MTFSSVSTVEGEPRSHRDSGPVHGSGSSGHSGDGDQAQGIRVPGRSHQAADGKTCSVSE